MAQPRTLRGWMWRCYLRGPTLPIVARLSQALRPMGVRELPLLVSVDDERDTAVLVTFADDAAASTVRVAQVRAALTEALIPFRIAAELPERRFDERFASASGEDARYYRLVISETERDELREFAQRASTAGRPSPIRRCSGWGARQTSGTECGPHRVPGRLELPCRRPDRGRAARLARGLGVRV